MGQERVDAGGAIQAGGKAFRRHSSEKDRGLRIARGPRCIARPRVVLIRAATLYRKNGTEYRGDTIPQEWPSRTARMASSVLDCPEGPGRIGRVCFPSVPAGRPPPKCNRIPGRSLTCRCPVNKPCPSSNLPKELRT